MASTEASYRLLLLSPPPTDLSDTNLDAAYGPAIRRILSPGQQRNVPRNKVHLDIAIQARMSGKDHAFGPISYKDYEKIVAGIYRLVVYICAEEGIDHRLEDRLDVAVILIDDRFQVGHDRSFHQERRIKGPVIPLETLASSQRPWTLIYAVEGEASELLYKNFTHHRLSLPPADRGPQFETQRVAGGTVMHFTSSENLHSTSIRVSHHVSVAVGGTFDHLHAGHKLLLAATALVLKVSESKEPQSRMLTIGITGDEMLKNKKFPEHLESWETRQLSVYNFLLQILNFDAGEKPEPQRLSGVIPEERVVQYDFNDGLTIKCVEFSDPFGPTITDEAISALVVSGETRTGGNAVNDKRKEKGWKTLEIFEVDVLDTRRSNESQPVDKETFESKISSTEIRRRLRQAASL